jgi:hypothetical protein
MKIFYRISDSGYKKEKPAFINNESCLRNFCSAFNDYIQDITIIADNISQATSQAIQKFIPSSQILNVSVGHGAGTFNIAFDMALTHADDEIVYFVENDYIHRRLAPVVLLEGFDVGFGFVTLYDHPDKYLDPDEGGNPFCLGKSEESRVYRSKNCHWKITNSTTMTFASRVRTIRQRSGTIRKWTAGTHPHDFQMFLSLRAEGEILGSAVPGYSTHGESKFLSPGVDWEAISRSI